MNINFYFRNLDLCDISNSPLFSIAIPRTKAISNMGVFTEHQPSNVNGSCLTLHGIILCAKARNIPKFSPFGPCQILEDTRKGVFP